MAGGRDGGCGLVDFAVGWWRGGRDGGCGTMDFEVIMAAGAGWRVQHSGTVFEGRIAAE